MLKRPHYIALGLIVVLTLTILNLPSRTTARLKQGVGSFFFPMFRLANASQQVAGQTVDAALPRSELLRQNQELHKENDELKLQLKRTEELARENDQLRKLFGWQQQHPGKLKLAYVIAFDPANWWRSVQINLGSRDGIRPNMPVLTPDGALAGRVSSVSQTRSLVVLLGDPNCKVGARVDNATGVIGASGPLESEFVEMSYLSKDANLKPGQRVFTSGDGDLFPPKIFIGLVVDSHPVEFGLAEVARVKLAANLNSLEEVWVKTE